MKRGEGRRTPQVARPAGLEKQEEEALIRTVLTTPKDGSSPPPRRKFALRGLESLVACVLMGARGSER